MMKDPNEKDPLERESAPLPADYHPDDSDVDRALEVGDDPGSGARIESIEPAPPHAKKARALVKARSGEKKAKPEKQPKDEQAKVEEAMPEDREGTYGI